MNKQRQMNADNQRKKRAESAKDAWQFFEDAIAALRAELIEQRELSQTLIELLDAGYAASDHVAIAGSYDNLKEGQRYIIAWRMKINEWRSRNSLEN